MTYVLIVFGIPMLWGIFGAGMITWLTKYRSRSGFGADIICGALGGFITSFVTTELYTLIIASSMLGAAIVLLLVEIENRT
jgi:hypothetical protein